METMLIIGGTKGIGKSCSTYFKDKNYNVITVARRDSDLNGDICNKEFQDYLVKNVTPDHVIFSAGRIGIPVDYSLNLNFLSTANLILKFYQNLKEGSNIINISSIAATHSLGHKGIPIERISYNTSKRAISDFCISLARSRSRNIKVTTIEPELVLPTEFNSFHKQVIDDEKYNDFKFKTFVPLRPIDIVNTIDWVLSQPAWVNVCRITINNHYDASIS